MRGRVIPAIVAVMGTVAPLHAFAAPSGQPSIADIDALEKTVQLPPRAYRLGDYARYYTVETVDGRDLIKGFFLRAGPDPAGRYLRKSPVIVYDGGCSVVTVFYDLRTHLIANLWCNGVG